MTALDPGRYGSPPSDAGVRQVVDQDAPRTDLRGVLAALRRHRWIIVATAALTLAVGLTFVALAEPVYESSAEVLIEPDVPLSDPEGVGRAFLLPQELSTQLQLITSDAVLRRATDSLGLPRSAADTVTVELVPDTRVVVVAARDPDAQRATDVARGVSEQYLAFRGERATQALDVSRQEAARQVASAEENVERIDQAIADIGEAGEFNPVLNAERFTAIETLRDARDRLGELDAAIQAQTGGGEIIEPAELPTRPVVPTPVRTSVVALLLGLGLGVVLALVRDTLDEAIHTDEDVSNAIGRPVIGRLPIYAEEVVAAGGVVLLTAPDSIAAEGFRDLRTNLRFVDPDLRSVAVTSSLEAEGKSSVAANLAVASSLAGFDVVLVDGDLRRPSLHTVFGVPNGTGLSDTLVEGTDPEPAMVVFSEPPLRLLTAGRLPPNPSELLGSQRFAEVLAALTSRHDLVIIDTPPALAASDAQEVASLVDATVLVVENERAGRRAVQESAERLARAGGRVAGAVVNRVDPRGVTYGYYRVE